ncbi:pentapeptide repeat-containing protein, partial [Deltaproteobacteria bacterium OttesenSCG-928-M10]|nr:pentapeptide repeat-containing protein [Deltaproteobacteria bacterium OttesenSCG-928-M10]
MVDIKRTPKPKMLFEENMEAFNKMVAQGKAADFSNQNLSDLDLRGFNLKNANLSGAYLRGANLGGVDLSGACMHGASLKKASIS